MIEMASMSGKASPRSITHSQSVSELKKFASAQLKNAEYTQPRWMSYPLPVHGDESWLGVKFA